MSRSQNVQSLDTLSKVGSKPPTSQRIFLIDYSYSSRNFYAYFDIRCGFRRDMKIRFYKAAGIEEFV